MLVAIITSLYQIAQLELMIAITSFFIVISGTPAVQGQGHHFYLFSPTCNSPEGTSMCHVRMCVMRKMDILRRLFLVTKIIQEGALAH